MILTQCPSCRAHFKLNDEFRARKVRCPKCRQKFRIEDDAPAVEDADTLKLPPGAAPPGSVPPGSSVLQPRPALPVPLMRPIPPTTPVRPSLPTPNEIQDWPSAPTQTLPSQALITSPNPLPPWLLALAAVALLSLGGISGFVAGRLSVSQPPQRSRGVQKKSEPKNEAPAEAEEQDPPA